MYKRDTILKIKFSALQENRQLAIDRNFRAEIASQQ